MNLEHHINACIYQYPSLYRVRNNPIQSRLHVLRTMFFVIGTGYEWDKNTGTLTSELEDLPTLPEGFFEKELYSIEVEEEYLAAVISDLNGAFYYLKGYRNGLKTIIFESNEKFAEELASKYIKKEYSYANLEECNYPLTFYALSEYSSLVELINGKTNSVHIENYSFEEFPPQESWVQGCIEVAIAAKEFYNVPSQYYNDSHHPSQTKFLINDYEKAEKKGKIEEYRKKHGYLENETFDERSARVFEEHRQTQLNYINQFLAKYHNG